VSGVQELDINSVAFRQIERWNRKRLAFGTAGQQSVSRVCPTARVLGVSMVELLGEEVQIKRARKTGPTGKVHKSLQLVLATATRSIAS
jgi:hypothetical protein